MNDAPSGPPVICTLSDSQRREREATLLARFKTGVIKTEHLANGYLFRLPGEGEWLAVLAELMAAERECCPFLTFQLTAEPQMGALTLRITGPEGTKQFLDSVFIAP